MLRTPEPPDAHPLSAYVVGGVLDRSPDEMGVGFASHTEVEWAFEAVVRGGLHRLDEMQTR